MIDLKSFREANKLTQEDLAKVLGVSRGFIGQVECGASKFPKQHLEELLANESFDSSMLVIDASTNIHAKASGDHSKLKIDSQSNSGYKIELLKAEVESLKKQLEEEKQRSAQYWEMIQKLMK